jgi:hypothetical protein
MCWVISCCGLFGDGTFSDGALCDGPFCDGSFRDGTFVCESKNVLQDLVYSTGIIHV